MSAAASAARATFPRTTREDERNFQNILVERGGVHVDDVVVRLASAGRSRRRRVAAGAGSARRQRDRATRRQRPS